MHVFNCHCMFAFSIVLRVNFTYIEEAYTVVKPSSTLNNTIHSLFNSRELTYFSMFRSPWK
jgi:hypothetical protein